MWEVLILSSKKPLQKQMQHLLEKEGFAANVYTVSTISKAYALLTERTIDLLILSIPNSAGQALSLLQWWFSKSGAGSLLLWERFPGAHLWEQAARAGGCQLVDPLEEMEMTGAIKAFFAAKFGRNLLQKERDQLQTELRELRLVQRAKACLMEYLQMSEEKAHRYIQKQAMNFRVRPAEVAEEILKTYEVRKGKQK